MYCLNFSVKSCWSSIGLSPTTRTSFKSGKVIIPSERTTTILDTLFDDCAGVLIITQTNVF